VSQYLNVRGYDVKDHIEYGGYYACGELDVLAFKDNYALVFEVKTTGNYKTRAKAINQLNRAERYCHLLQGKRVFKFYVHGNGEDYITRWITN